jgi:hypothetical protein
MSSDSSVEIVDEKPPIRTSNGSFRPESIGPYYVCEDIHIEIQIYNSCLVHAIINATQRHDQLKALLRETQRIAKEQGLQRTDVLSGILATKHVLGYSICNGFNSLSDDYGIAHVTLRSTGDGHFISLRRIYDVIYIMDSLNGKMAPIINVPLFFERHSTYVIKV